MTPQRHNVWETMTTNKHTFTEVEKLVIKFKNIPSVRREDDLVRVRNLDRQIMHVDEEIDQKVYRLYRLYGLTEEEIRIVEGK